MTHPTQWSKTPRKMLLKRALEEAGKPGLVLQSEITRLLHELAGQNAAVKVLAAENEKLKEDYRVEREHRERLSYMMAEVEE